MARLLVVHHSPTAGVRLLTDEHTAAAYELGATVAALLMD